MTEQPKPRRRGAFRRRLSGAVLGGVMLLNTACYTYTPLFDTRPQPGQRVALELTDQGRAALGDQLGPGVLQVEGMLQEVQNDQYVVSVSRVSTISGGSANWGGERVRIPAADVGRAGLRSLSRGRTALAVGAVIVGLGVFIGTRGLSGSGLPSGGDSTSKPTAGTSRAPR